jgi:type IV pilus assembly protein PilP
MVGTLYIGESMYGLIQTSDGLIHRVIPGNFMGQNDGRIIGITESEIDMVEIISDGIGGYIERDAAIALSN